MSKSLKRKYLVATQKSIDKYQKLVDKATVLENRPFIRIRKIPLLSMFIIGGKMFCIDGGSCALCRATRGCRRCPVKMSSGGCGYTPWRNLFWYCVKGSGYSVCDKYFLNITRELKAERDYLKIVKSDIESDKITWKEQTK